MKGDDRVDEALPAKGAGNMERFLALHEFEPEARQRLPHAVYEYVAGGAGEEHSIRANQESYQRIFLRPRVLRSVAPVDLSQELFGRPLPAPVLLSSRLAAVLASGSCDSLSRRFSRRPERQRFFSLKQLAEELPVGPTSVSSRRFDWLQVDTASCSVRLSGRN
jgi:hypothetical protein